MIKSSSGFLIGSIAEACNLNAALNVVDQASLGLLTLFNGAPAEGYNVLAPSGDPIQHIVDRQNYAIYNITVEGHQFHPGQVRHGLNQAPAPSGLVGIYLTTLDTGDGKNPGFNNAIGYMIFTPTHTAAGAVMQMLANQGSWP